MKVDFPEPDGPITARNSPACTSSETPRKAFTRVCPRKYVFFRSRTVMTDVDFALIVLSHRRHFRRGGLIGDSRRIRHYRASRLFF